MIKEKRKKKQKYTDFLTKLYKTFGVFTISLFIFSHLCSGHSDEGCDRSDDISFLLDEESESFFCEIVEILKAGMKLKFTPKIYISTNKSINSCATHDGNIIINIGMIINADNVKEIIAVLAHELAHINGLHITTLLSDTNRFYKSGLITAAIGTLAAVASMNASSFIFGIVGGAHVSQSLSLAKMRQKESIADTEAANCITKLQLPVFDGFISLYKKFSNDAPLMNAYFSSHPSSFDRLQKFQKFYEQQKEKTYPKEKIQLIEKFEKKFQTIKEKIKAIGLDPEINLITSKNEYIRSIILYRTYKFDEAINILDKLMLKDKNNYFLAEIKVLCLIGQKKLGEAINVARTYLNKRKKKLPRDLSVLFSHSVVENTKRTPQREEDLKFAVLILERLKLIYPNDLHILDMLGRVYDTNGDTERSSLCIAEMYSLIHDKTKAIYHAKKAFLSNNLAIKTKAQDIICENKDEL